MPQILKSGFVVAWDACWPYHWTTLFSQIRNSPAANLGAGSPTALLPSLKSGWTTPAANSLRVHSMASRYSGVSRRLISLPSTRFHQSGFSPPPSTPKVFIAVHFMSPQAHRLARALVMSLHRAMNSSADRGTS
ncbi:hypothetical protein QFZ49_002984 [Streptomyces turgidiscabies]|uniref:Uncharacterized protein n=1 Tax=Streptomyces turgidiscabies TaxID=85558 RepID=A0ABU0RM33_9ACTN|nr:hypothetical protein [Streptomyces turgidiscabies]